MTKSWDLFQWFNGEPLYLHFLYTKDSRLQQIKKKHELWKNRFSDVFTYHLSF